MNGVSAETALERIEAALVRIEAAAEQAREANVQAHGRHDRLREVVTQSLRQLDLLLAAQSAPGADAAAAETLTHEAQT